MKPLETNHGINTALAYTALRTGALLMVSPFIWVVFTNSRSVGESTQIPPTILPKQWMRENHLRAITSLPIMRLYVNTALLVLFQVLCAVAFSSATRFVLVELKLKRENPLFFLVIIQMMLSSQVFIIPQYQILAGMGLTGSIFVLIFLGLVDVFDTFFLRQVHIGIPDEPGKAACLGGCTGWQAFAGVIIPSTKTSMAAPAIFTVMFVYTDLVWPLIADINPNMMTLPADFSTLRGQFVTNYPVLMAGPALVMAPIVILYLIFQEQSIEDTAMADGKQRIEIKTEIETDGDRYIWTEDDTW